jgi:hypothetical protein
MLEGEGTDRAPELVETPPNPLAERLRDFRDGVGDQPDEDKPSRPGEEDDEADAAGDEGGEADAGETGDDDAGTEGGDEADDEAGADDDAAGDEGEADDEGEDGDEADAPAGSDKLFSLHIPTLNADGSRGPRGAGVLQLDGLPQEYRDTIQSHVKRSLQLDSVQQRLTEARELETVARFYQRDPLNAMRLVAVEKPELANTFVSAWMSQHPKATKALFKTLKLDTGDEEKLELQGQLAERKMIDELDKAYTTIDQGTAQQDFVDLSKETVGELIAPLQLEDSDRADFEQLAGARIVAEMERRVAKRQSPYSITKTEILTLLQPLIKKFTGVSTPTKKSKGKAGSEGLTREQMADRANRADRFRKLRGGGRDAGVRPSNMKKTKMPRDLGERIKLLRAGKL